MMLRFLRREHLSDADLSARIDGRLSIRRSRAVAAHLDRCPRCRQAFEGLQTAKLLLGELPRPQPARSFILSPEAAASEARPRPAPRRPAFSFAPAAALVLLVALLAADFVVLPEDGSGGGGNADSAAALQAERATAGLGAAAEAAPTAADAVAPPEARQSVDADTTAGAPAATGDGASEDEAGFAAPADPAETAKAQAEATEAKEDAADRTLLRILEGAAAVAFLLSALMLIRARSGKRRGS